MQNKQEQIPIKLPTTMETPRTPRIQDREYQALQDNAKRWLPWRVLHSTRGYCGSPGTVGTAAGYCTVLWVLWVLQELNVTVGYCGSTRGYCRVLWVLWVLQEMGTAGTAGVDCRVLQGTA